MFLGPHKMKLSNYSISNEKICAGTICAVEPSQASCFDSGDSGSGLMMERFQGGYSWEGALSFYRGCDQVIVVRHCSACWGIKYKLLCFRQVAVMLNIILQYCLEQTLLCSQKGLATLPGLLSLTGWC